MSNPTGESKDIFTVCKQNVEKFFSEVKKSTPRYHLTVTALQQEYFEAWKKVIDSAIALEQEYAIKAGLNTNVPEATMKIIRDFTEQAIQAYEEQNKISLDATEEATKAFNAFNENTKSFSLLTNNIMLSIMSVFQQKS